MSWRTTIRYFVIPAIALLLTFKIYVWADGFFNKGEAQSGAVQSIGEALIGGDFKLIDQNRKMVQDKDFRGKFMLVYFGFSHCPDVCPTDLALITNVMNSLGDDAKKIQPIFITVDPERDSPEELKKYLSNFYPGIIGLTGTPEKIAEVANEYRIYYKKVESKKMGEYLMDHSAFIYLMGKDGKYITHFNGKQSADEIVEKIKMEL